MKKFTFELCRLRLFYTLFLFLMSVTVCAQTTLIDNKGNRNQSYPLITQPNPKITQLINRTNQDSIEAFIRYMQGFSRVATSPAALTVQNWLVDRFESFEYEDISIHYFTMFSQQLDAGNVVVVKKGTEFPNEYIMITSHYDHSFLIDYPFLINAGGPGADDNASGTAGVLECARLFKNFPTKRSIMFVTFNAEEYWMMGSLPFAQKCAAENMNIIAHFNMDMIGWFPPGNPNTIMASGYSDISKALFEYYQQTANTYIPSIPTIRLSDGDIYGGDHMPFNIYEYPSLYIGDVEYKDLHPCYHKMCDTIGPYIEGINCGVNRLDLAEAFVQATLCSAAELANAWLPPQNLSACSGIDKITVSWDCDNESTSYKIFRDNLFLKEVVENFYVDYDVEIGNNYEYYVIAVNNRTGQETASSDKDKITFVEPLHLPYSNDFSDNKYGFEQSDWSLANVDGKRVLCNSTDSDFFSDNYLSIAELDWFPIPHNIENISIRFKWSGFLGGVWYNTGMFFEVTNDRKTWHKLAYISGNELNWKEYEFSLNRYIDSDFFQVRFRLESSGSQKEINRKIGYITDVEIDYVPKDDSSIKENTSYIPAFNFAPNPASTYINIVTDQQEPYLIAIYDMAGKMIFVRESFKDGAFNVSQLKSGSYLLVISTKQHRVAKKLMIQ